MLNCRAGEPPSQSLQKSTERVCRSVLAFLCGKPRPIRSFAGDANLPRAKNNGLVAWAAAVDSDRKCLRRLFAANDEAARTGGAGRIRVDITTRVRELAQ